MSFLSKTIEATKNSQSNRAEYDRVAGVLYNIVERRVKKHILARASSGHTDAAIDLLKDCSIDIISKWSISELLFDTIFEDTAPVAYKLFFDKMTPFGGFDITNNSPIFSFDWTHAMLQENPNVVQCSMAVPAPNNTPPPPMTPSVPNAPIKNKTPLVRNLFGNEELPEFSQDEIVAYLSSLMPQIPSYK